MKNLDFLNAGKIFPPLEEAKRIGACADYDLMFDGNTYAVEEKHFKQTLNNLNKLALLLGWTKSYVGVEYNYFKLCSKKTADFICGEIPDITASNTDDKVKQQEQAVIDEIRNSVKFDLKHYDAWLDVSKYGESYLRVYSRNNKNTFTLQHPAMIIRVVDEEDDYEIKNYVVAWITNNATVLKVQIHEKGFYTEREYSIAPAIIADLATQRRYESANANNRKSDIFTLLRDRYTDEVFRCTAYKIKAQLGEDKRIETYLDDFAIIPLSGIQDAAREHGVSDYDDFDSIVASIQRTMTQVQMVFDKYTTPTAYCAEEALNYMEERGESALEIGKAFIVPDGGTPPGFLEPDLTKLEYYFRQLEFNVARIKELSEMGAALNCETSGGNIAVETMKATYTSAIKKAERLTTKNTDSIKQLFHLISLNGYDCPVPVEDIQITWYDGLPNDEEKDVRVAAMKVQGGFTNRKQEFVNRFNHTEEAFDDMWTQLLQEENDFNATRAVGGMFNPFGGNGGDDGGKNEPPEKTDDDEPNDGTQGKTPPDDDDNDEGDGTDE